MRRLSGELVVSGRQMARDTARYFAGISARHVPDPLAVRRVLEVAEQYSGRLDTSAATQVRDAAVSRGEVAVAMRHVKPGTAPGPDGLAPKVWRHCGDAATELLALVSVDTIDREFLYQCLLEMGASSGMINLARLLLHDTRATTHVNGVDSTPRIWHSGVSQGCPLSPLLYLVMAQALTSSLGIHPALGIHLSHVRLVSNQHADDTAIFLADLSPNTLTTLTQALSIFAAASNQRANIPKSMALPTQPPSSPAPQATVSGTAATAAGCVGDASANSPPHPVDTSPRHQCRSGNPDAAATHPSPTSPVSTVPNTINGIPLVDHALSLGVSHTPPDAARNALTRPHSYTDSLRHRLTSHKWRMAGCHLHYMQREPRHGNTEPAESPQPLASAFRVLRASHSQEPINAVGRNKE